MWEDFFLASDDWGEPWGPRTCECAGTCRARQTNQFLLCVKVTPPLPGELVGRSEDVSELLLGSTNDTGTLSFIVDIYTARSIAREGIIDVRDLIRIGTGTVHESRMQAELQYGKG